MKKLVLSAMLVGGLAHLATGCVINGGDPVDEFGGTEISWELLTGDNDDLAFCPGDASTMLVHYGDHTDPANVIIDVTEEFFCADGSVGDSPNVALSGDLVPGIYDVWLELLDLDGNTYAVSFIQESVAIDAGLNTVLSFAFTVDRGYFYADWNLTLDGLDVVACEDAGASYFALDGTYIPTSDLVPNEFVCNDFYGETRNLPLGEWTFVPSVLDIDRGLIEMGDSIDNNFLDYGNQFASLGIFVFDFVTTP